MSLRGNTVNNAQFTQVVKLVTTFLIESDMVLLNTKRRDDRKRITIGEDVYDELMRLLDKAAKITNAKVNTDNQRITFKNREE